MPEFSLAALLDASLVWLADHTLVFLALSVIGVLVAAHLLLRGLEQDLDRLDHQARIARSYDAARDDLARHARGYLMAIFLDWSIGGPEAATAVTVIRQEQAERAVWDAKRAIGTLTRLAADAETNDEALRLYHLIRDEVESSSTAAVLTALVRADRLSEAMPPHPERTDR